MSKTWKVEVVKDAEVDTFKARISVSSGDRTAVMSFPPAIAREVAKGLIDAADLIDAKE